MSGESFYLHVVSTDSLTSFPANTASKFTNILPIDVSFPDVTKYEVALSEISYNSNFYNISDDCAFGLFDFLYSWSGTKLYGKLYDLKVPSGNYENPEIVCGFLNSLVQKLPIPRLKNKNLFSYNRYTRKFDLVVADLFLTIIVKGSLIDILGLERRYAIPNQIAFIGKSKEKEFYLYGKEKRFFKNKRQSWVSDSEQGGISPFVAQMTSVSAFLVYVDFVGDIIYGSNFSNVIRTVAIRGSNNGERVVDVFSSRMYVPVKLNQFNSVSVEILDFRARPLQFQEGNTSLTFHFRPKSSV